jgi:hypothetical protein
MYNRSKSFLSSFDKKAHEVLQWSEVMQKMLKVDLPPIAPG